MDHHYQIPELDFVLKSCVLSSLLQDLFWQSFYFMWGTLFLIEKLYKFDQVEKSGGDPLYQKIFDNLLKKLILLQDEGEDKDKIKNFEMNTSSMFGQATFVKIE